MAARWPQASRKLVEQAANGYAVIDSLKGKIPGIVPVKPRESKYARASAVAPFIEAGNAFLPDPAIALFDTEAFVTECSSFPNDAHDDQVDAASQALAEMLLDGTGAQAWIDWAKRKAAEAAAADPDAPAPVAAEPADSNSDGHPVAPAGVVVPSSSGNGTYLVTPDGRCSCPAGTYGKPCKHLAAAGVVAETPQQRLQRARQAAFLASSR
jgi:hypothetical protein